MILHAYNQDLDYLGCKEIDGAITVQMQNEFELELLAKHPEAVISFDVEPTERELSQEPRTTEDLPF